MRNAYNGVARRIGKGVNPACVMPRVRVMKVIVSNGNFEPTRALTLKVLHTNTG